MMNLCNTGMIEYWSDYDDDNDSDGDGGDDESNKMAL